MRALFASTIALFLLAAQALADGHERFVRMGWTNTDFSKSGIDLAEVMSGGPPRDGIPSIDKPAWQPVSENTALDDREPVIGLEIGDDARAYPLRILIWHEIVNDVVGGKPVTVTYCPLCNAAIVFDRTVDGKVLDFGTTGLLRHSDLVMYDRQTETWWQQFTGQAIVGEQTGKSLDMLPARLESWASFRQRHPDGKVLVPNNPAMRSYGRNPYTGYDTAAAPFLYRGRMPDNIKPMARVVVYRKNGAVHAIALKALAEKSELRHGGVMLKWSPGQASALDTANIAEGRDVGNIVVQMKGADGNYMDIPYDVTFAFVVTAFHPDVDIKTDLN